jgi:hypothetical protein
MQPLVREVLPDTLKAIGVILILRRANLRAANRELRIVVLLVSAAVCVWALFIFRTVPDILVLVVTTCWLE